MARNIDNRKTCDYDMSHFDGSPVSGDTSVVLYQASPVDPFLREELFDGDSSCIHICRDVGILLNQKRISRDMVPLVQEWFDSHGSDLSDQYPNLTDAEIKSCIKSKYLQAPSELQRWTEYLMSELDELAASKSSQSEPHIDSQSEPQTE